MHPDVSPLPLGPSLAAASSTQLCSPAPLAAAAPRTHLGLRLPVAFCQLAKSAAGWQLHWELHQAGSGPRCSIAARLTTALQRAAKHGTAGPPPRARPNKLARHPSLAARSPAEEGSHSFVGHAWMQVRHYQSWPAAAKRRASGPPTVTAAAAEAAEAGAGAAAIAAAIAGARPAAAAAPAA